MTMAPGGDLSDLLPLVEEQDADAEGEENLHLFHCLHVGREGHEIGVALGHRAQCREETERDEGQPVARDSREVLSRGDEHHGRDEQTRRQIAAERAHERVGQLHGPLDGHHRRRIEERGEEGEAGPRSVKSTARGAHHEMCAR
jgi:hypothetical protein